MDTIFFPNRLAMDWVMSREPARGLFTRASISKSERASQKEYTETLNRLSARHRRPTTSTMLQAAVHSSWPQQIGSLLLSTQKKRNDLTCRWRRRKQFQITVWYGTRMRLHEPMLTANDVSTGMVR